LGFQLLVLYHSNRSIHFQQKIKNISSAQVSLLFFNFVSISVGLQFKLIEREKEHGRSVHGLGDNNKMDLKEMGLEAVTGLTDSVH
jgi:hypothetical protein